MGDGKRRILKPPLDKKGSIIFICCNWLPHYSTYFSKILSWIIWIPISFTCQLNWSVMPQKFELHIFFKKWKKNSFEKNKNGNISMLKEIRSWNDSTCWHWSSSSSHWKQIFYFFIFLFFFAFLIDRWKMGYKRIFCFSDEKYSNYFAPL